ncbi:MAG: response regulator transcription factor [Oscillospiraceae bacterium]
MLLSWCQSCPEEALRRHPDALCVLMRKLYSFRQIPELMRLQKLLLESLQAGSDLSEAEKSNYLGECDLVMSFLRYNDIAAMSELHRSACARMTRTTRCINLGGTWTFGSPSVLMMFHRTPGQLDEENAQMRACMPYYYKVTDGHGSGAEHSMQCETDLLRGRFTDAEIGCHLARDAAQARGQYSILLTAEFTACGSSAAWRSRDRRDARAAARDAQIAAAVSAPAHTRPLSGVADAMRGRADPGAWYLTPEADASFPARCCQCCASCRMRCCWPLANGRSCCPRRERALNTALHTCLADIYLHIQLACAQFQLGRREDAQRELGTARRLAAPDGLTLPFTEHAALLGPLLRSPETAAARSRVSSLSPRELEIAQLAAARRTNAEIAEALHLSEATVKNHLKRIFDKLGLDGGARGKRMLLADVLPKISP